jgi:serine/threonine-protein kinase
MAPEQAAADPLLDHRVDIYAVGIMAYELLTGRPPFIGMSTPQILAAHVTQAPDSLLSRRPACPPALAAVIMRCLEKRPADRWQSAEELLHQLEAMGTPTGGTAPTGAMSAVGLTTPAAATPATPTPTARVLPASGSFRRSGYLVLGILLALVAAWGVMRPRGSAPVAATASARRVVVLPFENQGDSTRQYFANGVTEAITTQLTGIAGLSVIPRSTAARYRGSNKSLADIGRELGVGYVLEGTVQFEEVKGGPPRVRVSPELIRVSDTSSVWAHGYDGVMSSVFQVYSDVAEQVARSLEVALNDPERRAMAVKPTESPEAYDLYLRANDYLNRGLSVTNFNTAIPMLERAVALDSNFAMAWGRMSEALALAHWLYLSRTDAVMARAEAAAKKALALQPDLPEAHRAMGNLWYRRREYDKALAEFAIVQRSQPNSVDLIASIAYVYRRQGRWEQALTEMRRRLQLDPASPLGFNDVAETLNLMRRYAEATEVLEHCIEIAPDEPDCYGWLVNVQVRQDTALGPPHATFRRALARMSPGRLVGTNQPDPWVIASDSALLRIFLGTDRGTFGRTTADYFIFRGDLFRVSGSADSARAMFDSARIILTGEIQRLPDDYGWHQRMGLVLTRLGRHEDGIREARRAAELMPPSKDAYFGIDMLLNLARCYSAAGQAREAVEQLKIALAVPSRISTAELRLQPDWDPIRNDAEFRKLEGN